MNWSRHRVVLAVLAAFVVGVGAARAGAAARRSLVLEVAGGPGAWRADALSRALGADLADDRLAPRAAPMCGGPCSDDALRAAGVELIARARLAGDGQPAALSYELRALWPGAPPPVRGVIALGGVDRVAFAGVLRDQLHRLARGTSDDTAAPDVDRAGAGALPSWGALAWPLGLALAVLALPIAVGALRSRRLVARAAALRTAAGLVGIAAVGVAIALLVPANRHGALLAAGGLAWGTLVAVTAPVLLPPLVGIGRIDYSDLGRLLAGWAGLVLLRAIAVAALYVPVALGIVLAGDAIAPVDDAVRFALVVPLGLLVARQLVRLVVAVIAERLDGALADPGVDAATAAAWQAAVRNYFVGYLRRNGLPIDEDRIDRLIVLPAAGDEVQVYGGGATATRLAIPRKMLELALAPTGRPHDYAAPRVSTLHWTYWNTGLVMATEEGAVVATREQRQPRETTTEADPGESPREPLGEPPTLIGIIEPRALDPRTRYRPHEDPAWLDWDSGEEYDGTDARDRDFLFGVVAHAIATAQRHADRFAALALALVRAGRIAAPLARPLGRLLERAEDTLGDDHTAISGARHHLVQYLAWEAWRREDLLTARAYAPELEAMSRQVMAHIGEPARSGRGPARARKRLARLGGQIHGRAVRSVWRRLALAGAVAAGLGAAGLAVIDAVRYHATYARRQTQETERPTHGQDK